MFDQKRYVINVDNAGSKIHLNPDYFEDNWCNLDREKILSEGGRIPATKEEAIAYRSGKKPLIFNGKTYRNVEDCKNCSTRGMQSVHWNIT